MSVQIIRGNALDLPLADASVDLVVTSPPYFALRAYQDNGKAYDGQIGAEATPTEFVDALIAATREMVRVVKPSGSIWVNLGDKYAGSNGQAGGGKSTLASAAHGRRSRDEQQTALRGRGFVAGGAPAKSLIGIPWRYALRCIDDLGLILRAEVIWSKPNGLPESVTDRVRRSHETWFHFVKEPRYYSAVDEVREVVANVNVNGKTWRERAASGEVRGSRYAEHIGTDGAFKGGTLAPNPLGKLPGSVWTIPTQPLTVPADLGVDHFAAFPMEWPRRIIRGWSPPDGTILDPFGGTGTTALVAHALGRHGISVDMSADYCRLARWRTTDPGQLAAAMQVEKPPEQPHGVDSLLDLLEGDLT